MTVKLSELVDALEQQGDGIEQYLDLQTGRFILLTEDLKLIADDDFELDRPEWAREVQAELRLLEDDPDRFVQLPSQRDFREGRMVTAFCESLSSDEQRGELLEAFRGRGAFRRFKDKADEFGLLASWYAFRRHAIEAFAIDWCEENEIALDPGGALQENAAPVGGAKAGVAKPDRSL
jgi:hypothetical protein